VVRLDLSQPSEAGIREPLSRLLFFRVFRVFRGHSFRDLILSTMTFSTTDERLTQGFVIRVCSVFNPWLISVVFVSAEANKKTHARPEKEAASMPTSRPWCVNA
jgi:hypothetical protein